MKAYRLTEELPWLPHATAQGVRIKPMITNKEHGLDVSCMLVEIPAGREVKEHVHPIQDDIIYPLSGKGTMWVDGSGEFPLAPGTVVRVPKETKHGIFDVTEDLLLFDVFSPALV